MTTIVSVAIVVAFALYHLSRWRRLQPQPASSALPWQPPEGGPMVSFLVPAWNAAEDLTDFIGAFRRLGYTNKELLLCVGGSDGGLKLARSFENEDLRVFEQHPGEGKQRSLQRLLPEARGALIYLTDIDCRPTDDAVLPLLRRALIEGHEVVSGAVRPLEDQLDNPFVRSLWAIERLNALSGGDTTSGLRGANAVVSRKALDASGGFSQEAPSGTDYTLAKELIRQGFTIAFARDAEMPTRLPGDLGTYVRKQARWLRNVVVLGARYGVWGEVRSVMITLALPFLLIFLLLLGLRAPIFWLLGLLAVAHAVLNRLRYAAIGGLRVPLGSTLSTVLGDFGAAFLATVQILRKRLIWS